MESFNLHNILNGEVNRLTGISYDQNPCLITLNIDEIEDWISDQEQILGIKWIKHRDFGQGEGSSRIEHYICHRAGKPHLYISNVPENKKRNKSKAFNKSAMHRKLLGSPKARF